MIWIVRDSEGGAPAGWVSVWSARPKRYDETARVLWLSPGGEGLDGFLGSLWLSDAWRLLGTTPDDDWQVIIADRDVEAVRARIARVNSFKVPAP